MRDSRLIPAALLPLAAAAVAAVGGIPASAAPQEAKKVALDAFLKGAITSFDGSSVEVRYDLADPAQLEDFKDYMPFRVEGSWKRSWLDRNVVLDGTGGVVWKPVLRKKVEMEFEARLKVPRDFGAFLAEDRPTDEFSVFSVYDQFFQNKDRRGSPKVHMICRFTLRVPDARPGADYFFRYVIRNPGPAVSAQKPVRVRLGRDGVDEWMEIDGHRMAGNEAQWPPLRGLRPGLYVVDAGAQVTNLVIRGDLEPKWAEENGVDLSLPVKLRTGKPGERPPTDADLAAEQRIRAVRSGVESPAALLRVVEDPALVDATREEAAKAVEESGDLRVVPRLVPLLESADAATRRLAARILSKLAGKTFGYAPDGPEEGRRRAVRSLLDWIEKNPEKFR